MTSNQAGRGSIFAIGGRESRIGDLVVLRQFVEDCGGATAHLLVISTATDKPDSKADEYEQAFRALGVKKLSFFHPTGRDEAADPELLAALAEADGVFFPGGSQLKLVSTLGGTPFEQQLRDRHTQGLHLGGTSAGAAAMSSVMIAGGRSGVAPARASVRMTPGFGFIPGVIIDQHFQQRDRIGRLLTAVLCNPSLLGFGLDEDTAFALGADDNLCVHGSGTLTIVDGSALESSSVVRGPAETPVAFAGMRLHVLAAGWTYDIHRRRVGAPPVPTLDDQD